MFSTAILEFCLAAAAVADIGTPRYRFEVGQELRYEGTTRHWYGSDPSQHATGWRLWVTQANQDGSWDIVVEANVEENARQLVRIAVYPDGHIPWNSTMTALPAWLSVRRLLPLLPTNAKRAGSQWTPTEPRSGVRWEYDGGQNGNSLTISATCQGPIENVSVGSLRFSWNFDAAQQCITSCTAKGTWQDYEERNEESLSLAETKQHDATWTDTFRRETDRYFQLLAEYESIDTTFDQAALVRAAAKDGIESVLKRARTLLESGENESTIEVVGYHFSRQIKRHDQIAEWATDAVKDFEKIVDKPALDWTAMDLDGKTHTLTDYRGKVVVLDFWFRKCSYCIRAQPQFDAVIEHFKDRPVQFLGMNVDDEVEDAKFAVAQLRTSYPTLLAKKVQEQYGRTGCPGWLILDQQGIVRSIHIGYSGHLQEELTKSISQLLR